MSVDEIQAGSSAKMSKQSWLDVVNLQRLAQKRIGVEINLADGKIVGRAPIGINLAQLFRREGLTGNGLLREEYRRGGRHWSDTFLLDVTLILDFKRPSRHPARENVTFRSFFSFILVFRGKPG